MSLPTNTKFNYHNRRMRQAFMLTYLLKTYRDYWTFIMLNKTEHMIYPAYKAKNLGILTFIGIMNTVFF